MAQNKRKNIIIMKNKKMIFLIGGIIFLAIILIYSLKSPKDASNGVNLVDSSGLVPSGGEKSEESEEIVRILSMLKGVSLKTDFFEDAVFLGLEDFSVQLAEEEMGRNNPFAAY